MSRTLCVYVALALVGVVTALNHVPVLDLRKPRTDVLLSEDDVIVGDDDATVGHWATDFEHGKWGKKFKQELVNCTLNNPTWSCIQHPYCTYWEGEFKISVNYETTDGKENRTVDVYIPSDAVVDSEKSKCDMDIDSMTYKYTQGSDSEERAASTSVLALKWLDGNVSVTLTFSNSSMQGCVGWKMFVVHQVDVAVKGTPLMYFKGHEDKPLTWSASTNDNKDGWWKLLSSPYGSLNQCNHTKTQKLGDKGEFTMQNVIIGALMKNFVNKNGTLMPPQDMCDFDYEKDDGLAVIIGTVQTAIVFVTLIGYLIYLNRRGPIEVPNWIVEPSMRNATVKKIEDSQYERRMSKTAVDGSQPVQRKAMPSDSDML